MKKQAGYLILVLLGTLSLVLSACNASADTIPTLTFEDNKCTYSGPSKLPSIFTLTWVINDPPSSHAYIVVTLDEDKTFDDLQDALDVIGPELEWVHLISRDFTPAGDISLTKEHNLAANYLFHGEPIYFVCFFDDLTDLTGPIPIK